MVAHGLITGMLFFLAGSVKHRYHTLEIKRLAPMDREEEFKMARRHEFLQRMLGYFLAQLGIDAYFTNPLHKVMLRLHGEE